MFSALYLRNYLLTSTTCLALVESGLAASSATRNNLLPIATLLIDVFTYGIYTQFSIELLLIVILNSQCTRPSIESVYQLEMFKEGWAIRKYQLVKIIFLIIAMSAAILLMITVSKTSIDQQAFVSWIFSILLAIKMLLDINRYDRLCTPNNYVSLKYALRNKSISWLDTPETVFYKMAENAVETHMEGPFNTRKAGNKDDGDEYGYYETNQQDMGSGAAYNGANGYADGEAVSKPLFRPALPPRPKSIANNRVFVEPQVQNTEFATIPNAVYEAEPAHEMDQQLAEGQEYFVQTLEANHQAEPADHQHTELNGES